MVVICYRPLWGFIIFLKFYNWPALFTFDDMMEEDKKLQFFEKAMSVHVCKSFNEMPLKLDHLLCSPVPMEENYNQSFIDEMSSRLYQLMKNDKKLRDILGPFGFPFDNHLEKFQKRRIKLIEIGEIWLILYNKKFKDELMIFIMMKLLKQRSVSLYYYKTKARPCDNPHCCWKSNVLSLQFMLFPEAMKWALVRYARFVDDCWLIVPIKLLWEKLSTDECCFDEFLKIYRMYNTQLPDATDEEVRALDLPIEKIARAGFKHIRQTNSYP